MGCCGCTEVDDGGGGGGGGGDSAVVFTYEATGAEGSDFTITIPSGPLASDDYVPQVTCGGTTTILAFDCPDILAGDRTATDFRVITTAALTAGDLLDVVIHFRT